MKVISRLIKMDFSVGKIERQDDYLVISSDPMSSTMDAKVKVSPEDAADLIRELFKWSIFTYLISLPLIRRRLRKESERKDSDV